MKLRDLTDLELAALAATMFELSMLAGAANDFGAAQFLGRAVRSTTREVLARHANREASDIFFEDAVSAGELASVRRFIVAGAAGLQRKGFTTAAALLEERMASEIRVDVSDVRHPAGVELRTLN